jgi:RHS repeat-associated protein
MKARIRSAFFAIVLGPVVAALAPPLGLATQAQAAAPAEFIPLAGVIRDAHFAEPLVATSPTTSEEDSALSRAVAAYERRANPGDVSSLKKFLSRYPQSGWAPALLVNLGLSYLHDGHFSPALEVWQDAWRRGKGATEPRARALVDRAVGELARLYASLGHVERLQALFEEIGDRPVTGSATEAVQTAREMLDLIEKDPRHLFICGPLALQSLMLAEGATSEDVRFLQWLRVGPDGTSLAEVSGFADQAKFQHRLVFRESGQTVPVPSIVHWKVGHFAAIVGEANGRFQVEDPVFRGQTLWVTSEALDSEASGYFLVAENDATGAGWRDVDSVEAGQVRGKGPTNGTRPGDAGDPPAGGRPNNCPLCGYDIKESSVSLMLSDAPVGYVPAIGPSAKVRITYNQREDSQPQNFNFFNIGPKWALSWLSYVTDDPTNPGANVSRYLSGGGAFYYSGYNATTGRFAAQDTDGSTLVRSLTAPVTYQRQLRDGSIEIYAQSDGSIGFPRRIFLSQVIDPQGNALTLTYDGQRRLVSLTDAVGRQTTFTYGLSGQPFLVTRITDPFGRSATLTYDIYGRLSAITDVIGLTSSFTYDANSLVNSMTTPYGTTGFAYTAPGTSGAPRFVQVTDPLGFSERVEWVEPAPIPASDPANTVPQGMPVAPTNDFLQYRNSAYWDKNAYVVAGCTPSGGCDYTKAKITHFVHMPPNTTIKGTGIESIKYPFENRIWYGYPGQTNSVFGGSFNQPTAIGRILDDGSTQLRQFSYDPVSFNLTQVIDPLGRTTTFTYSNNVDIAAVTQTTAGGSQELIAQFTYNTKHQPLVYTDAASQTTTYEYNGAGQLTSLTNPLGQTTSYQYDANRNLATITNANNATAATFTYDAFARVHTYTDSEGWTATYDYDAADRVTRITYPDGSTDTYVYDKLDLASYRDRQGRSWTYTRDPNRRLTAIADPLGQQMLFGYNPAGKLTSLTDPKSNVTSWSYDVQGRLTSKQYADTRTVTYTYETTTSRLKSITDALGQTRQFSYTKDSRLTGISYINAINPTPDVSFAYDVFFPRRVSMTDSTGTTQYSYVPVGSLGALQRQQEIRPLPNSAITYAYDALGRLSARTVSGSGAETFQYDAIGRQNGHASDLGSFALSYLGQTEQITQRQLVPISANLVTSWSYLTNSDDRRLAGISNVGLSQSHFSNYQFTTTPEDFITAVIENSDAAAVYPAAGTQTATYNNLNQLTNLSGQTLTYDANGNLLSDGQRTYSWDAENRLVGIAYPAQPGKQSTFVYDGLGRRTAIASAPPGGGSATTTSYVWCGDSICQARNTANAVTRSYYDEGELVPGSPAQPYYYGIDQLGSVRRAFASTSNAPVYGYDPYGNALQGGASLTDFGFAGMFYHADSGLYLTKFRAYDPVAGRWLSRDPMAEMSDPAGNLYPYVGGNPISYTDPTGEFFPAAAIPVVARVAAAGAPVAALILCRLRGECRLPAAGDILCLLLGICPPPGAASGGVLCPPVPPYVPMQGDDGGSSGSGNAPKSADPSSGYTPSPAVPGDPYNPAEVDRRRSGFRNLVGAPSNDPDIPIPDQGSGRDVGGHRAKEGTPHETGERNVNPNEEHSRRPKGNPTGRPRR